MPKFKIELELNSINERILVADYDSSKNSNETLTFDEQLQAIENDVFNLSFSISDNLGHPNIQIGNLINVGRPLWLHLYNPDRSIRMVITSVSPVIGSTNVIYNISAVDYASFVFARNNAGLTLNTITDENFLNWLDDSSYSSTNITSIGTYILEKGWLRNSSGAGWEVSTDVSMLINISVSGSNTYGALIELAKLTNTNLKVDYVNEKFYFIDREAENLDKNYSISRDFNMNELGVTYSGEELYSLLYVNGGENEFGQVITLGQVTDYLDSFVEPDFEYFVNANLLEESEATTILNTKIKTDLKDINEELQNAIINRFTAESQISDMRARIEAKAEEIILTDSIEAFADGYETLVRFFEDYRQDQTTLLEGQSISTPEVRIRLNSLPPGSSNFTLSFPITLTYKGGGKVIENDGDYFSTEGENNAFQISLTPITGGETFTQNGYNFYIKKGDPNFSFEFDSESLIIVNVQATYSQQITYTTYNLIYPYFEKLDMYNGQTAINKEQQRIVDIVDFYKDQWDSDRLQERCLLGEVSGPQCEEFNIPNDQNLKDSQLEYIRANYDDYKNVIGKYDPDSEVLSSTELGKYTLMLAIFNQFESNYTLISSSTKRHLPRYKDAVTAKQNFWYNLKKDRQHIFQEGYYENTSYGQAEQLFLQGEFIYQDHKEPKSSISISYIDISDIIGKDINQIEVGDFIQIKEDKLTLISENTKLKVAGYSKQLRNDNNISLEIFRYDMYNSILERIMALSQ